MKLYLLTYGINRSGVGREVNLASSATLSRFEKSLDRKSLVEISKLFVEHFIERHQAPPKELILDFYPTDNETYGQQEHRFYHGYYKHYCFLPLHVFCGDDLLVSLLRPSHLDSVKYAKAVLKLLVIRLRQVWPEVKISFRADSAFARDKILCWCERNEIDYVVGMPGNQRLKKLAAPLVKQAEEQYKEQETKQRLFSEYQYAAHTWKKERRVIAKAEHHNKGSIGRFVISNLNTEPKALYDDGYCPYGDMENGIKQLKLDLHSD